MDCFSKDDYQNAVEENAVEQDPAKHKAPITHELIAGAASYEAAKAYENYVAENSGQRPSHEKAKEIFFAGAFIDKEFETHGLDAIGREEAKHAAHKYAEQYLADEDY